MNQDENQQGPKKVIPIPPMFLFVAGACVLLFFNTTHIQHSRKSDVHTETIEIALAREPLRAGTVITSELIIKDTVPRDKVPEGPLPNTLKIIGRILAVPVVEGQVLTELCFIKKGIGEQITKSIPHGMCAMTVAVTSKMMPDRVLLYPGCMVDVVVCYKLSSRNEEGDALSQTMLIGIHVIAVPGDTIVSQHTEEGGETNNRRSTRGTNVTLLVTPRQAEALYLAVEYGSLSMTLRNPLDREPVDEEGSVLKSSVLR